MFSKWLWCVFWLAAVHDLSFEARNAYDAFRYGLTAVQYIDYITGGNV